MNKDEIRTIYKQKRAELSEIEIVKLSSQICFLLSSTFTLDDKKCSIFLPIKKFNEVDTFNILDMFNHKQIIFTVSKSNASTGELDHFIYEGRNQLKENQWGIPEPMYGVEINPTALDVVLVPLLAFSADGHRVGYGKGYYDRFLKKCRKDCLFIGLSLFDEPVEINDINEDDIALHKCVTPNKVYSFEK